jgi:threonine dehydrogenase-like Zn-dependent dehydrogenase
MKAAVLHEIGGIPRYEDFPDPVPGDGEVMIEVKAVASRTSTRPSRPARTTPARSLPANCR